MSITVDPVDDAAQLHARVPTRPIAENARAADQAGVGDEHRARDHPNESGQTVSFQITGNTNAGLFSADPAVSSNGTLSYEPAASQSGSATITLHIEDNGGTGNGGDDTGPNQTFTITVDDVNDPPSFTKGANQTVNEDSGGQSESGWATNISPGPGEGGQSVNFIVNGGVPDLFSSGPAVSPGGTLTYTPSADANGSSTVTASLHDDGGTANGGDDTSDPQTFTITVNAVNDPPSFTKGANQTVPENAGPQTVPAGPRASSKARPNEASQTAHVLGHQQQQQPLLAPARRSARRGR